MAVSNLTISGEGAPLSWRLNWDGGDPAASYRVFRNGLLLTTTDATSLAVGVSPGSAPVFEVLDDPDAEPADAFPDFVTLAWFPTADTALYRIEERLAGVWTEVTGLPDDGSAYYRWQSDRLDDGSTHVFRVVPVGTSGNDGDPAQFTTLCVRVPDPPDFTLAYDKTAGTITFDVRA